MATVKSGDNLSKMARQMGVSLGALMAANPGINPHLIRPGQHINSPSKRKLSAKDNARQMSRMVGSAGFRTSEEIRSGKTLTEAFADKGIFAPATFQEAQQGPGPRRTAGDPDAPTVDQAAVSATAAARARATANAYKAYGFTGSSQPSGLGSTGASPGLSEEKRFLQSIRGTSETTRSVPLGLQSAEERAALGTQATPVTPRTDVVGRSPGDPGYIRTGVGSGQDVAATGGGFNLGTTLDSLFAKFGIRADFGFAAEVLSPDHIGRVLEEGFSTPDAQPGGQASDTDQNVIRDPDGNVVGSAYSAAGMQQRADRMKAAHPDWSDEEIEARLIASNEGKIYNPESTDHGRRVVDATFDPRSDTYNEREADLWVRRQQHTESSTWGTPMGLKELEILGFNVAREIVQAVDQGRDMEDIRENLMPEIAQREIMAVAASRLGLTLDQYIDQFRYISISDDDSMYALADRGGDLVPYQRTDFEPRSFGSGGGSRGGGGGGFGSPSALTHDWRIRIT